MIRALVLSINEAVAEDDASWLVQGEKIQGIYTKEYSIQGRDAKVIAKPFWPFFTSRLPNKIDCVLIFSNSISDILNIDSTINLIKNFPTKFIISNIIIPQDILDKFQAKYLKKSSQSEIVMELIQSHNELIKMLKTVFSKYEKEPKGSISLSDLGTVSSELGKGLTEIELQFFQAILNVNKNNMITFEEFIEWWTSGRKGKFGNLLTYLYNLSALPIPIPFASKMGDVMKATSEILDSDIPPTEQAINFLVQANPVSNQGLGIEFKLNILSNEQKNEFSQFGPILGYNLSDFFVAIRVKSQNAITQGEKFKGIINSAKAILSGINNTASMILDDMIEIRHQASGEYIYCGINAVGSAQPLIESIYGTFENYNPLLVNPSELAFSLKFGTDLKKLCQEEIPLIDHAFMGAEFAFKANGMRKIHPDFSKTIEKSFENVPADLQFLVPLPAILALFQQSNFEIILETDEEKKNTITSAINSLTQNAAQASFSEMKVLFSQGLFEEAEKYPLAKKILDFFRQNGEVIDLFISTPAFCLKWTFTLNGLGILLEKPSPQ